MRVSEGQLGPLLATGEAVDKLGLFRATLWCAPVSGLAIPCPYLKTLPPLCTYGSFPMKQKENGNGP